MRLTQTLKQKPTVSPQLVLANKLLQFSSLELEQAIAQELAENPALELAEIQRCPACGAVLSAGSCPACAVVEVELDEERPDRDETLDGGVSPFSGTGTDGGWNDSFSHLPSCTTLAEHLLRQARLGLDAEDVAIARHVIGGLDDRGFFSRNLTEVASELGVERRRVEQVLTAVQSLEPAGIAARNVRECLLIQIADLGDACRACPDGVERSVAERLIRSQWDSVGRSSLENLGREVDASVEEVRGALRFIRENLNPYPAHTFWTGARQASSKDRATCPQPDVIILDRETSQGGYEIELPKAGSYGLRVRAPYRRALDHASERHSLDEDSGSRTAASTCDEQRWRRWEELCGRARLFVRSIEQRWETLHDLMSYLVDYQHDFLVHGEEHLKPLTRARVAEIMGVHESTVSRAVAGKYAQLPCGKVVSLDAFFDSAAPIKHAIEGLVSQEENPLSDKAIAERLAEQGYDISRRTVAKYRNALNILPSTLRKRDRELGTER